MSDPAQRGDPAAEYRAAVGGTGVWELRHRGVLQVTGRDRGAWLHNLVTNAVKTLQPGEGNYAFACNVKGRILFDCNVLVLADAIWLDVDRVLVDKALTHLERYHITEDVQLQDRSAAFARFALVGPRAADIADALGAPHAAAMPALGSGVATLVQKPRLLVRHDALGVFGIELYVESEDAAACRQRLLEIGRPVELLPISDAVADVLRIESGIPLYGRDIDEEVLPAETLQLDRAVSFVKGCYLGQEVVERMRAHSAVARKLVGLRLGSGSSSPLAPFALTLDGAPVGRVTSCCRRLVSDEVIGLGYVKSPLAVPGKQLTAEGKDSSSATVSALPLR